MGLRGLGLGARGIRVWGLGFRVSGYGRCCPQVCHAGRDQGQEVPNNPPLPLTLSHCDMCQT